MFPRDNRLRKNNEILTVLRNGGRFRNGAITLFYLPAEGVHVTVIVDKKLSKLAVVRNLVKRRIRAGLKELGVPAGNVVVRAFPGAEKVGYAELRQSIEVCLKRIPGYRG